MIAHIDADSFFASVLVRKDPKLRSKPLLALGMGGQGFVIAATYEAKAKGVKTGMRVSDALKLCPEALRIPSDFRETGIASHEIEAILQRICPQIEQMSVDEWYLDLQSIPGGEPENLEQWAKEVQSNILQKTALSVSIGVAPTKLLAKMAGEYRKPASITIVSNKRINELTSKRNQEVPIEPFLRNRPAASIPGIGRKRSIQTDARGWKTAWDIATAPTEELKQLFGKQGPELQRELLGEVVSAVEPESELPKSISRARSFRGTFDRAFLWAHVLRHLEYAVMKMRRDGLAARGITVWLRDQDYAFKSEHRKLPQAMDTETQMKPCVESCFKTLLSPLVRLRDGLPAGRPPQSDSCCYFSTCQTEERAAASVSKSDGRGVSRPCTQTGLILWNLVPRGSAQYSLFQNPGNVERDEEVQRALDSLHNRYGRNSLTSAAALQVETGTRKELRWTDQNSGSLYS